MFNPLVLYGAGAALLVGLFAGWTVRDWKADSDMLAAYEEKDQLREKMQAKIDASSATYEDWRSASGETTIQTRNTIREIYRNVEVPADCAVPADARSLLEDRVRDANASATGQPSAGVPKDPDAASGADRPRQAPVGS